MKKTHLKKIILTILVSTLLVSTASAVQVKGNLPVKTSLDDDDFDPLVDVEVTVEIQKIRAFDKYDAQVFRRE
ncbi:MAG: hypothetical protein JSW60_09210, partial [Thermoplasmatales archaeon]